MGNRGFILPTTLMVMTLLTVMLTAAFILVSSESRTTDHSFAAARALARAEAGLQQYLTNTPSVTATSTSDSTRITLGGGYVDVVATRLVPGSGTRRSLWLVRATATATEGIAAGYTQAKRSVAQFAYLNPGWAYSRAALTALNSTTVTGISGNFINGLDYCGTSFDTTGLSSLTAGYSGPGISGSPGRENFTSLTVLYDSSHIDWLQLINGNFVPDYDISSGTWPSSPAAYSIFYSSGNVTVPAGTRSGTLVAQGDITLSNNTTWNGLVIAGGRLITPASYTIMGAATTGLNNVVTPGSVAANTIQRTATSGYFGIRWNVCTAYLASLAMSALAPVQNAWIGSWGGY